jgi:hypothetical protein
VCLFLYHLWGDAVSEFKIFKNSKNKNEMKLRKLLKNKLASSVLGAVVITLSQGGFELSFL